MLPYRWRSSADRFTFTTANSVSSAVMAAVAAVTCAAVKWVLFKFVIAMVIWFFGFAYSLQFSAALFFH
jgi:hypothetical protein